MSLFTEAQPSCQKDYNLGIDQMTEVILQCSQAAAVLLATYILWTCIRVNDKIMR